MRIYKLTLLIAILVINPSCSEAGWKFVSPMPKARYGHDATLGPDGKIYVMGGFVWYDFLGRYSNLVYKIPEDKWVFLEPVPGFMVRIGDFLIYDKNLDKWRSVRKIKGSDDRYEIKRPNGNGWVELHEIVPPEKMRKTNLDRQGDGPAIVTGKDGLIYWMGGSGLSKGSGEDVVFVFDPQKDTWPLNVLGYSEYDTGVPCMLERRIDHEAVVTSDGKIYVMGGRRGINKNGSYNILEITDSIECYDHGAKQWKYKKSMPFKRFLFVAVLGSDDKIYTFGGRGEYDKKKQQVVILNATHVYDPKTDAWTSRSPMPEPRYGHAGVLGADGKIYIIGGGSEYKGPPLKTVFIYDPLKDKWSKGPSMKLPRDSLAAVATPDGKIYAIGGTDKGAYENKAKINRLLPGKIEFYTGKVQDTVEVLDIFEK